MNSDAKLLLRTDKTPKSVKPGIFLSGPVDGICPLERDVWIHGAFALGESELHLMPAQTWLQCLIVCGVSRANQFSYMENIIADRVVFPEEIQEQQLPDGSKLNVVAFNFELMKTLGFPPHKETIFVQAVCLSFRSEMLEIKCG